MMPLLATVIMDPATAMIGGCALALFSARLLQRSPEKELHRTALLGAGWGLYYGLAMGWMFFKYPDWMFAYLLDTRGISLPLSFAVFVAVLGVHGGLAALGASALVLHKRFGLAVVATAGVIATNLLLMAVQKHAYDHFGTLEQYTAGVATPLAQESGAQLGLVISTVLTVPAGLVLLAVRFLAGRKVAKSQPVIGVTA